MDDCIRTRNWSHLYALFLGGGGPEKFKQHAGGLATGCDASAVKLEQVIEQSNVPRLEKFVSTLLKHNAAASHEDATRKQPFDVAKERKAYGVVELLKPKRAPVEKVQVNILPSLLF